MQLEQIIADLQNLIKKKPTLEEMLVMLIT